MYGVKRFLAGLALVCLAKAGPAAAVSATLFTSSSLPVITITIEPLEETAFKPYGQVIAVPDGVEPTTGSAILKYWGGLAKARFHEEIEFGLLTVKAREREVAEMERHIRTPEFLVGLKGDFILVVAPPGNCPDALKVRAFRGRAGEAVVMAKGAWHALPFSSGEEGLFLVGFREGTARWDLKTKTFRKSALIKFR